MGKLVVLTLQGDLIEKGFQVTLEIYQDQHPSTQNQREQLLEQTSQLPPNPQLQSLLQEHWQQKYRELGAPYRRIQPQQVIIITSKDVQKSAEKLRHHFNAWLRHESFLDIHFRLLECLRKKEEIQFLIRTDNLEIKKLPWQEWSLIRESFPQSEITFSPINFRQVTLANPQQEKLRILAVLGHSQGIDIHQDRQFLDELSWAEVKFLVEPKRQEINDQLWQNPWDIIFFAGHSETEADQGRIYINPSDSLTIDELWLGLKQAVDHGLKLAIFNSCDGLGLTQRLDDLQIPQMVVMRELVPDKVAHEFLKYFLEALSKNQSLYLSFREARERLHGLEDEFPCASWLPVIYQHGLVIDPLLLSPTVTHRLKTRSKYSILTGLVSAFLIILIRQLGGLEILELKAFDQLMLLRLQQTEPDPRLLLIEVTEEDIPLNQTESLSDQDLDKLLQKINQFEEKPAIIALDIYRKNQINQRQFPTLYQQIRENPSLIMICMQAKKHEKDVVPPPGLTPQQLEDQVGFNNFPVDQDGIIRRHIIHQTPWSRDPEKAPCQSQYSFAALIANRYIQQQDGLTWENTPKFNLKLGQGWFQTFRDNIGGGGYFHNLDKGSFMGYQILFNYQPLKSMNQIAETLTLGEVINENKLTAAQVKDRIILIGTTGRSNEDYHRTPYTAGVEKTPGVIIQGHIISYLLRVALDGEPALKWWPRWLEWLWISGWSIIGSLLFVKFQSWKTVTILLITLAGSCYFILILGYTWVPFIPPLLTLILVIPSLLWLEYYLKRKHRLNQSR